MDPWVRLESLLETDAAGIGCAENMELVHAYAEGLIAGADPEASFSALTAHLRQCPPCAEDLRGLVLAVQEALGSDPRGGKTSRQDDTKPGERGGVSSRQRCAHGERRRKQ